MIKVAIFFTSASGQQIPAGELIVSDPDSQGRLQGQFRYHQSYLSSPFAIPLDPIHLPLSSEILDANRPQSGVHGVFEDSLPDDWGRKIMIRRYMLPRDKQRVPHYLQLLQGNGLGALSYGEGEKPLSATTTIDTCHLTQLQELAQKFEEDPVAVEDNFALLFQAGSSPGGARPKALIQDGQHEYIAKFASIRDQFAVVPLEAATMELAQLAGLSVAETKRVPCGETDILLVKRFDVHKNGGRHHLISMQTLLAADGYYTCGYRDMARVIRQVSDHVQQDLLQLYKQLVFNVLLGNTDDHLKNFCMMHNEKGWQLTPAYDLVPNIPLNQEHSLFINDSYQPPNRAALIREASSFLLKKKPAAEKTIDHILHGIRQWKQLFHKHSVPEHDIRILGKDIEKRIARIASSDDQS